jgi:DNA-binding transcriptional LysR family regulator
MKHSFTMQPSHLPALAAFEAVARHGSFTRAADELSVSTSALSQTVRKLEQVLSVRLLSRTSRRVAPTEAGARFLAAVGPGLATLAEACAAVEDESDTVRGTVRVSLSRVAHALFIAPHLPRFLREHPAIHVELGLNDGLTELVAEGYDLGIRLGERLPKDMVAVPLGGEQRLVVVAAPAYLEGRTRPGTPADLAAHECIRLRFVTSGRSNRWWMVDNGAELDLDVDGRLVLNDMNEVVAAALLGSGVAQVFEGLARPHVAARTLVRLMRAYEAPFPGFRFYYPSRAQLPAKLRAFIEFFQKANRSG